MNIKECCFNCNYYRAHYAKDDNGQYYKLNNGHCSHLRTGVNQFRRCMKLYCACPNWQQAEIESEDLDIIATIKNMATRIEQIAAILKVDRTMF